MRLAREREKLEDERNWPRVAKMAVEGELSIRAAEKLLEPELSQAEKDIAAAKKETDRLAAEAKRKVYTQPERRSEMAFSEYEDCLQWSCDRCRMSVEFPPGSFWDGLAEIKSRAEGLSRGAAERAKARPEVRFSTVGRDETVVIERANPLAHPAVGSSLESGDDSRPN
jgi:hypothetical protein